MKKPSLETVLSALFVGVISFISQYFTDMRTESIVSSMKEDAYKAAALGTKDMLMSAGLLEEKEDTET